MRIFGSKKDEIKNHFKIIHTSNESRHDVQRSSNIFRITSQGGYGRQDMQPGCGGVKATTKFHPVQWLRTVELCLHSPIPSSW
jgi:hypothetical protein